MTRSLFLSIYAALPPSLQSTILTVYGLHNLNRRRLWMRFLRDSAPSEYWPMLTQRNYVAERLLEMLTHAVKFVPYYFRYRRLLNYIRNADDDVFAALSELPPVSKSDILSCPEEFCSTAFTKSDLRKISTSGTTGTPFATWLEPQALVASDALWWRRTLWAGYTPGDWIARLVGDPVVPIRRRKCRTPWRISISDRRLYLSTYHLSDSTAPLMIKRLNEIRPAFLMGYPSALFALIRLAKDAGLEPQSWTPKAILYSSEPLYDHQRDAIRDFFRAPIYGLYGCAERVLSASQCDRGVYHLSLLDGYLEGQFDDLPNSAPARVTGLLNRAMPLIRYEIGDTIRALPHLTCACGRSLPAIESVLTKEEDSVITPSGRVISPSILTWAFKDLDQLYRSQIIQTDRERLLVRICAPLSARPLIAQTLRNRLSRLVFNELHIQIVAVDDIPITPTGKTRFVVNTISRDYSASIGASDTFNTIS